MQATIILGNQLFEYSHYQTLGSKYFLMIESTYFSQQFHFHQLRLAFQFMAMRFFRDNFPTNLGDLSYFTLSQNTSDFWLILSDWLEEKSIDQIVMFDVVDQNFREELETFLSHRQKQIVFKTTPMFLHSQEFFKNYFQKSRRPLMAHFYQDVRRKNQILMEKDNRTPLGKKWSHDDENRKKIPKKWEFGPSFQIKTPITEELRQDLKQHFPNHPGQLNQLWLPHHRPGALVWLNQFIQNRLSNFGRFEDAIDARDPFLYHSTLSPLLNLGLITPKEVISEIIKVKDQYPLNSVEGLIRQIIGWREFVYGIHLCYDQKLISGNFLNHHRDLSDAWYQAKTGIPPLDDCLQKTLHYGYNHHIERLMIIGNIMLLSEIAPKNAYQWFMEMYLDSSQWVMTANVYGMSQFSDGGLFTTKPYFCSSNYWLKMSNYSKGDWCHEVDSLFWRFVRNNQKFLSKNPRLSVLLKQINGFTPERWEQIETTSRKTMARLTLPPNR